MNPLRRIGLLTANTFLEAVRQRFFNLLLLLSVGFVLGSLIFRTFNFGEGELKFIADFGMGALTLFGAILAIVTTAQLYFSELDNRTALTLLAKPVRRLDLLLGKFLGVGLLLFIFSAVIVALLAAILRLREAELRETAETLRYADLLLLLGVQWLKFALLSAITLFIASFARSNLFTVATSFMVLLIGHLQYIAQSAYADADSLLTRLLTGTLSLLFPNLQVFNIGDHLLFAGTTAIPAIDFFRIAAYGIAYSALFLAAAALTFRTREL